MIIVITTITTTPVNIKKTTNGIENRLASIPMFIVDVIKVKVLIALRIQQSIMTVVAIAFLYNFYLLLCLPSLQPEIAQVVIFRIPSQGYQVSCASWHVHFLQPVDHCMTDRGGRQNNI